MGISALDYVSDCYSWDSGQVIGRLIRSAFAKNEVVTLSFAGVSDIPSSFANAAFVSLLDSYSYDYIRSHLIITNATRQISDMIKRRFAFEQKRATAALATYTPAHL
jgi:hypothetical protein